MVTASWLPPIGGGRYMGHRIFIRPIYVVAVNRDGVSHRDMKPREALYIKEPMTMCQKRRIGCYSERF